MLFIEMCMDFLKLFKRQEYQLFGFICLHLKIIKVGFSAEQHPKTVKEYNSQPTAELLSLKWNFSQA